MGCEFVVVSSHIYVIIFFACFSGDVLPCSSPWATARQRCEIVVVSSLKSSSATHTLDLLACFPVFSFLVCLSGLLQGCSSSGLIIYSRLLIPIFATSCRWYLLHQPSIAPSCDPRRLALRSRFPPLLHRRRTMLRKIPRCVVWPCGSRLHDVWCASHSLSTSLLRPRRRVQASSSSSSGLACRGRLCWRRC